MRLGLIRLLSVSKHLRWRLELWSPLAGRQHRTEEVVLQAIPESEPVSAPFQHSVEPVFGFGAPVSDVMSRRVSDPFEMPLPEQKSPEPPEWSIRSLAPEPALALQEMDEGDVEVVSQEGARLSGWRLVLIGIVVVLLSLGSFFI